MIPDQAMPSSSPVCSATSASSQGSVTGTTPKRERNRPAVGKVKTRRPSRSFRDLIGLWVAKLQGSHEPAEMCLTPTLAYSSFQIASRPQWLKSAGTSSE